MDIIKSAKRAWRGPVLPKAETPTWSQIESLMALYRVLDGQDTVPSTRFWAMSPDILLHIARIVRDGAPQVIVECGCGSSTIISSQMLKRAGSGRVYALEHDEEIATQLQVELKRRGLQDHASVIHAPLTRRSYGDHTFLWYEARDLPDRIDLLIVDGPPGSTNPLARYPAGPELFSRLVAGSKVILDDAKRRDEKSLPDLWKVAFPRLMWRTIHAEKGAIELWIS